MRRTLWFSGVISTVVGALVLALSAPLSASANLILFNEVATSPAAGEPGGVPASADPRDLVVSGHYAYTINRSTSDVSVFDLSDPLHPVVIATTPTAGTPGGLPANALPEDLTILGTTVLVANYGIASLSTVDVSDPEHPRVMGTTPAAGGYPTVLGGFWNHDAGPSGVVAAGHYAYVSDYDSKDVTVVDFADAAHPVVVGTTPWAGVHALDSNAGPQDIALNGHYVYTADYDQKTVSVIDVSDPTAPIVVGTTPAVNTPGGLPTDAYPRGITIYRGRAYVANTGGCSVSIVNIDNPASPYVIGTTPATGTPGGFTTLANPQSVVVSDSFAFSAGYDTGDAYAMDVNNPSAPFAVATTPSVNMPGALTGPNSHPSAVALYGRYLLVADSTNGRLSVLDVSTWTDTASGTTSLPNTGFNSVIIVTTSGLLLLVGSTLMVVATRVRRRSQAK